MDCFLQVPLNDIEKFHKALESPPSFLQFHGLNRQDVEFKKLGKPYHVGRLVLQFYKDDEHKKRTYQWNATHRVFESYKDEEEKKEKETYTISEMIRLIQRPNKCSEDKACTTLLGPKHEQVVYVRIYPVKKEHKFELHSFHQVTFPDYTPACWIQTNPKEWLVYVECEIPGKSWYIDHVFTCLIFEANGKE